MGTHSWGKSIPKTLVPVLALLAALALFPGLGNAQKTPKKLSKQDVMDLLTGDIPSDEVAQEARKAGISFQVTPAVAKEIHDAGGTDELISVLRSLSPRPPASPVGTPRTGPAPSPPVLVIQSNPGQSQVYIDDEPVGSTSQEGRLKMTRLPAGDHTVRISLSGYQDHEETVSLAPGETTTVAATLQRPAAPAVYAPPPQQPQPEQPPTAPTTQPSPSPTLIPQTAPVSFRVAHDHGRNGQDYCVGVMTIGNGKIYFRADNGIHNFEISVNSIKEARRNAVYLAAFLAFHIRMKKGNMNYNFAVVNQQNQPQPPDAALTAIWNAMGI
jgi:hypothetical protein